MEKKTIMKFLRADWRRVLITVGIFIFFIIGLAHLYNIGHARTIYTEIIECTTMITAFPLLIALGPLRDALEPLYAFTLLPVIICFYAYILSCLIVSVYDKLKSENKRNRRTIIACISILAIGFIILVANCVSVPPANPYSYLDVTMEQYNLICGSLCQRYIDANFTEEEARAYCERYFEIDLNENGKTYGEVGKVCGSGVCEDRVYCFNIKECRGGHTLRSRLTPEKCKDIMCEVYTERHGDNVTAAKYIQSRIDFGSCDEYDEEISYEDSTGATKSLAGWWLDTYQSVHCSGENG